jgi:hypothetical protein
MHVCLGPDLARRELWSTQPLKINTLESNPDMMQHCGHASSKCNHLQFRKQTSAVQLLVTVRNTQLSLVVASLSSANTSGATIHASTSSTMAASSRHLSNGAKKPFFRFTACAPGALASVPTSCGDPLLLEKRCPKRESRHCIYPHVLRLYFQHMALYVTLITVISSNMR